MIDRSAGYQIRHYWGPGWRCLIFLLGSLSIGCLLSDFYKLCPMRVFTPFVFVPGLVVLLALAMHDLQSGDGELCRAVLTGLVGGLFAAVAYDLFRLPFVFSREWKLASIIPPMNLFKVFPRFGAMILGQPLDRSEERRV